MKQCPTCNRTYLDDILVYCLNDGSLLSVPYDPEATQRIPLSRVTKPPMTEILPVIRPPSNLTGNNNNSLLLFIAILLALILGGGAVALLKSGSKDTSPTETQAVPTPQPITPRSQTTTKEDGASNQNRNIDTLPLTVNGVRNLITHWVSSQNAKDLVSYQSCYGPSFQGVKRTASGHLFYYDFNGWMKDRRRMISEAVGLSVEVKNMNVNISGDIATVEFDQYYRSLRYSDWGPKVIKVKMTPAGEKIVYEELKISYPLP